ncbi:hypothetical protein [Deinococcus petrolearius]|uniref:Uncharacterized protein n=1 Tax=Deinococcus petrolearius TaxID=1751295 RepID=A0ABW1DLC3_9DEIO
MILLDPQDFSGLERELLEQMRRQPAQQGQLGAALARLDQATTAGQLAQVEDHLTHFFFAVAGYTLREHPAPALYRTALALALHCAAPRRAQLTGERVPESEITLTVRPLFPGEITPNHLTRR